MKVLFFLIFKRLTAKDINFQTVNCLNLTFPMRLTVKTYSILVISIFTYL